MRNKYHKGFTLIELMVVVAIIGILVAIAYPSYAEYVMRSRRTDAKAALSNAAQAMEKFYTERMTYNNAVLGTNAGNIAPTTSLDSHYTIGFDTTPTAAAACAATATTNTTANAYRLCATPAGSQTRDTSCGTYSLGNTGVRSVTGSATNCWN